jgi:hypothetical protein
MSASRMQSGQASSWPAVRAGSQLAGRNLDGLTLRWLDAILMGWLSAGWTECEPAESWLDIMGFGVKDSFLSKGAAKPPPYLVLHIQVSAGDESRMAGDGGVLYGRR